MLQNRTIGGCAGFFLRFAAVFSTLRTAVSLPPPTFGRHRKPLHVLPLISRILLLALLIASPAASPASGVLDRALNAAGADPQAASETRRILMNSATATRQLPLLRALAADPLRASYRIGVLASTAGARLDSPLQLMNMAVGMAGVDFHHVPRAQSLDDGGDNLAVAVAEIARSAGKAGTDTSLLPDSSALPPPLRDEIARMLLRVARAERFRQRAFAALPAQLTPQLLIAQTVEGPPDAFAEPDYRRLLQEIEREALYAGMLELVDGSEALAAYLGKAELPALSLQFPTALGTIRIDTTGADNDHSLADSLLLIDSGGQDRYRFQSSAAEQHIGILIDLDGDDEYLGSAAGAGPAAAVLGYSLLWDHHGNDRYGSSAAAEAEPGALEHDRLTQAAALFGVALLADFAGDDRYRAFSHAQGWALGGAALLLDRAGSDHYLALGLAQASAGPEGVALLIDGEGDDQYQLAPLPLRLPSTQLPDRNLSMGQGAAMGHAAASSDGRSTTGGIGALFDFAGNDHYQAEVFAQGAGYHESVGLLVDSGGNDRFDAAWYAMGAAAHRAAGILLKRGTGDDRYHASHSTSIGAAHDLSVAFFVDEGGNDEYHLGDLGLGGAHDNSWAIFVDAGGEDRYQVDAARCLAFGAAHQSSWGGLREDLPNLGLFFDLGDVDRYLSHCKGPMNDAAWTWPRQHPALELGSESGAGIDGKYPNPFLLGPRTPASSSKP